MSAIHIGLNKLWYVSKDSGPLFLKEWLSTISSPLEDTTLILSVWMEQYIIDQMHQSFESLKDYKFKKIYLICDRSMQYDHKFIKYNFPKNIELILVNIWGFFVEQHCPIPNSWIDRPTQGLLLTGKLYKLNRFGLLVGLYNAGLLSDIMWSFPEADAQYNLVKEFSDANKYQNFDTIYDYCKTQAMVDPIHTKKLHDQLFGIPELDNTYPKTYINNNPWASQFYPITNYSIISETDFDMFARCSEKTYRAIFNKHPFIMVGSCGTLALLESMGYRTFTQFLPIPNYDEITDPTLRLNATIENIKAFPKILKEHQNSINQDIEHNFNLLHQTTVDDQNQILKLYTDLGIPHESFAINFEIDQPNGLMSVEELVAMKQREQLYLKLLQKSK